MGESSHDLFQHSCLHEKLILWGNTYYLTKGIPNQEKFGKCWVKEIFNLNRKIGNKDVLYNMGNIVNIL